VIGSAITIVGVSNRLGSVPSPFCNGPASRRLLLTRCGEVLRRTLGVMHKEARQRDPRRSARAYGSHRHDTDRLIGALARLREAEARRHETPQSSHEFEARVREEERQAREVFRLAELERVRSTEVDAARDWGGDRRGPSAEEGDVPPD